MLPDEIPGLSVHWQSLGRVLRNAFSGARDTVVLIAPFIKRDAFMELVELVPANTPIRVVTRWRPAEIAAGVSDTSLLDEQESDSRIKIYLNDDLHAKLYMIDSTRAFVGSANCTATGLSLQGRGNIELLVEAPRCPVALAVFVKRLIIDSELATPAIRAAVDAQAAEIAASSQPVHLPTPAAAAPQGEALKRVWLPALRFPDQLFAVYADESDPSLAARDAGSTDLAWIDPPPHLDKTSFESVVQQWLQAQPLIRDLNQFLGEGRFFGEISEWMSDHPLLIGTPRLALQKQLQTLERWLLHFCGDLYALDAPHYSERLRFMQRG